MNHDYDYLSDFFKSLMAKHEEQTNGEYFSIYRINLDALEQQIQVVDTSTPKKTTNELLDEYIDLITLHELFGDEGYKFKSEYILGLLNDARKGDN